jgi:hypothetical protein
LLKNILNFKKIFQIIYFKFKFKKTKNLLKNIFYHKKDKDLKNQRTELEMQGKKP